MNEDADITESPDMDDWLLLLRDGASHPVYGSFTVIEAGNHKKIGRGTIAGDQEALWHAFDQGGASLLSPDGQVFPVALDSPRGRWHVFSPD